MRVSAHNGKKRVVIDQGEYYTTAKDEIISTLLGSCVACCLWDPVQRIIGMNHFLLANRRYSKSLPVIVSDAGRYGIQSMELLINKMLKMGAKRQLLKAKAFGGGNVLKSHFNGDPFFAVGEVNSRFIREFLDNENIPLVASHLGGEHGRVIHFDASDFSVYMKRIESATERELIAEEKQYFDQQIREHSRDEAEVVNKNIDDGHIRIWD